MDISSNGASTSVKNTPQAKDDVFGATEDVSIVLDVMANDLGGNGKALYSLDQSNPLVVQTTATSQFGAKITMVNGKVVYDTTGAAAIEALAQGQTLTDTFTYAIRMGNGAISIATVKITVTGTNDAPILSADTVASHALVEQAGVTGSTGIDGTHFNLAFTDVDLNDSHTVSIGNAAATWSGGPLPTGLQATLNAALTGAVSDSTHTGSGSVGLTFGAADKAFDFLAAGETLKVTYDVTIADNNGATSTRAVSFTVTGTNDAPVLSADAVAVHAMGEIAGATAGSGAESASTTLSFTDVDLNDTHGVSVGAASATWSGGSSLPSGLQSILDNAAHATLGDSIHSGSGSVGVAFSAADNAFDFLAAGETLTVTYNVSVADSQGAVSTQPVTFTVTGTNDAPVLTADAASHGMTEIAGVTAGSGVDFASASLSFTDADFNDTHILSIGAASAAWSGGSALPDGLQAVLDGALHSSLTDSTHGAAGAVDLAFSAADNAFDFLADGETLTVTYDVSVTDSQGAVSTQPVTFTVTGTNDAPVLSAQSEPQWTPAEAADVTGFTGSAGAMAGLTFTDVDLTDSHTVALGAATAVWSGGSVLPDGLQTILDNAASPSVMADTTGSGSGAVGVTFTAADNSFDFLSDGETLTVTYNVTVSDGHGGTATQPISFLVTGTNDVPVFAVDSASHDMAEIAGVTAGSGVESASASLSFADVDLNDTHSLSIGAASASWSGGSGLPSGLQSVLDAAVHASLTDTTHGAAGSVNLAFSAADDAFDFLADGETLTVTYDVSVDDHHGGVSTQPVTFTVTGTNDAPVLAADSGVHAMTERSGLTGSSAVDTATTTLTFTDVDLNDAHGVGVSSPLVSWTGQGPLPANLQSVLANAITVGGADSTHTGAGTAVLTFSAADSAFDFLGAGQTLTVTYNVLINDVAGATSAVRPVTFTVTGTNDAPVLAADSGVHALTEIAGVTNGSGVQAASTVLGFTDADLNDTHAASAALASATWSNGTIPAGTQAALNAGLSLVKADFGGTGTGQVTATFSAADKAFDFLGAGETLTATYNVTLSDGHGGTSIQPVTFTVTGTNDAPVLSAAPTSPQTSETFTFESSENPVTTYNGVNELVTDRDFTFSGNAWNNGLGNPGGMVYAWAETLPGGAQADWHRTDGKEFSLQSLDLSGWYTYSTTQVTIEGFDHGALVATKTVTLGYAYGSTAYQTVALSGSWSTVDDVKIFFGSTVGDVLFDNIKVGAPIAGGGAINLGETSNVTGSSVAKTGSATLTFTDVDLTDHHTASVATPTAVWSGGATLPSGLISALTGALTPSVADSTGTGTGSITASFSAQDHTFDFLAVGETLTVSYSVTVSDGHGGTSTQPVTITVTGTNDAPVVAADAGSHATAESGASTQVATSTLALSDADLNDSHTVSTAFSSVAWSAGGTIPTASLTAIQSALSAAVAETHGTGSGQMNLNFALADSAMGFLAQGETLTATYNVTVNDGHGSTSTQAVTYTIAGVNSAPVLTASSANLITNGDFEAGAMGWSNTGSGGAVEVNGAGVYSVGGFSGNVLEIDANGGLPVDDVSQVVTLPGGSYTLSFDTADRSGFSGSTNAFKVYWNGQLIDTVTPASTVAEHHSYTVTGAGPTGKLEFVEINSDGVGGIVDNVSLVAVNTTAVSEQGNVTGSASLDSGSFQFKLTDANYSDTHTVQIGAASAVWSGGALPGGLQTTLDQAASYSLADAHNGAAGGIAVNFAAQDQAFDFLGAGETLQVTYNVTVNDNHGGTSTQPVTFTVTGANDAPVLTPEVVTSNLITNGTFETADFSEWTADSTESNPYTYFFQDGQNATVTNSTSGQAAWFIRDVGAGAAQTFGGYTAFNAFDGSGGNFTLSQTIHLSGAASSAELSFDFGDYSSYSGTSRTFDVYIETAGGTVLQDVYSFVLPTNDYNWTTHHVDLNLTSLFSGLAAGDYQILFKEVVPGNFTGPAAFGLDNVSLQVSSAHVFAENAGTIGSTAAHTLSAVLSFTDVDVTDHHTASVATPTAVWSGGSTLPAGLIAALTGALTSTVADSTGTGSGSVTANFSAQDHTFDFLAAGETLTVTYDVSVSDGHGGTSTQPLTVTINGAVDAPILTVANASGAPGVAIPLSLSAALVDAHSSLSALTIGGLSAGVTLSDGAGHSFTASSGSTSVDVHGWSLSGLALTASSSVGAQALTVVATALDANGATASTSSTLSVDIDHPPVAAADTYTVNTGTLSLLNPVNNDTDPDGDVLAILSVGSAAHGTVTLNQDGTVSYTSAAGYTGADVFSYSVGDGHGGTATGTVNLTVQTPENAVAPTLTVGSNTVIVPTDGSAMKTSLSLQAGDVVSFQWNFTTDDYLPFKDFAFATVNGVAHLLSDIQSTGSYGATGWQTFTFTAPTTGTYVVGQGVMNDQDQQVQSYLTVDNMRVNGAVVNSFEGSFGADTTTTGQVSIVSSAASSQNPSAHLDPTNGANEALLVSQPTSESSLETFLGLPQGSLVNIAQSSGAEYTPILLPIGVAVPGSAHPDHTYVSISGAPVGSVLNHGTYDATSNIWTVDASDLGGNLSITTPSDYAGSFTLSVTATSVVDGSHTSATTTAQTQVVTVSAASVALTGVAGGGAMAGGSLADTLTSGPGNDVMTGNGGSDAFVFNSAAFGKDTINDFTAGVDTLQINHAVFADAATALSHAAQVGSDVVITYDAADTITLKGVLLSNLHTSDFHIL